MTCPLSISKPRLLAGHDSRYNDARSIDVPDCEWGSPCCVCPTVSMSSLGRVRQTNHGAKFRRQIDRWLLQRLSAAGSRCRVPFDRRRILVVSFDMFPMMSCAEAPSVTIQPRTIGGQYHMIPDRLLPRQQRLRVGMVLLGIRHAAFSRLL